MEKGASSGLFVNDGSFMEKFKQLQQEKEEKVEDKEIKSNVSTGSSFPTKTGILLNKKPLDVKMNNVKTSGGKLAFSLKQKSKLAAPAIKLGADEDEDGADIENGSSEGPSKRQKLGQREASKSSPDRGGIAPSPPSDPEVKKVADKLASFVAKNGRQFEDVTRKKNPGDTPFKFLFDSNCSDYKYYEYRLLEEENALAQTRESQASRTGASTSSSASRMTSGSQRESRPRHSNYQTPASALYETHEDSRTYITSVQAASEERNLCHGDASAPAPSDPIAMMEFYMKKAAQEERKRQPKLSKDEMPPPASLQAPVKKGHHMGDYIPQEELDKFLSSCNDVAAQKAAREAAEKAKIQADNVGHKLLSKMGWKEGEGLGSSKSGRADPLMAGNVKLDNLGVGAENPGEVTPDDDIYDQYKKRMMLGYRYRPNPLNNPRKAYY